MIKQHLCWLVLLFTPWIIQADTLKNKEGKEIRKDITITSETYEKINYFFKSDPSRTTQSINQYEVAEVVWDSIPDSFKLANNYFNAKNYTRAIREYKKVMRQDRKLAQYCLFNIAEAYRFKGNYRGAIKTYTTLQKKHKKNKYLPDAHFNMGECYSQFKKWRQASSAYKKAERIYKKINKTEESIIAAMKYAQIAENVNRFQEALNVYKKVSTQKRKYPQLAQQANSRIGFCLLGTNQHEKAKSHFLKVIMDKKADDKVTMRTSYLGLGNYYFEKDAQKALMCYLRVIILYSSDDALTKTAYDRAINCFKILQKPKKAQELKNMSASKFGTS